MDLGWESANRHPTPEPSPGVAPSQSTQKAHLPQPSGGKKGPEKARNFQGVSERSSQRGWSSQWLWSWLGFEGKTYCHCHFIVPVLGITWSFPTAAEYTPSSFSQV